MLDARSHFLYHAPCPTCGSKDNLAVYSSGSAYCFGCGYFKNNFIAVPRSDKPSNIDSSNESSSQGRRSSSRIRSYPNDTNNHYPRAVVEWIQKYDLLPEDLIRHNVFWSPSREQLIYTFYGEGTDVVLWQARNFRKGTTHKHRFITGGSPEATIAKYSTVEDRDTCVVVEDCISGIKVSYAGVDGVPCFSSSLSREKLARLARLYKRMIVWLDSDKYSSAQKIVLQGAALGMTTRAVYTEADPKEYPIKDIKEYIKL